MSFLCVLMELEYMHSTNEIDLERFRVRLIKLTSPTSARAFAIKSGISPTALRKYIDGESTPNLERLIAIAKAGGVSVQWLATGDENMVQETPAKYEEGFTEEFALIPGYSIQVSAGHGALNLDQLEPSRHLAFRRKWLKFRGFLEKDLVIVWTKGDSMEPTINNNDTLVVHTGRTKPQDGNIYIFRNTDELFVKRYQSVPSAWRLISDNPMYDNVDIKKEEQHQFEVIGQVVHIAKDIGD